MATCVIIDRKSAAIQRMQRTFVRVPERRVGNVEETLNTLGVMGNYVRTGDAFDVYVSEYVKVNLICTFVQAHGLYKADQIIFIDGSFGEDETITDEDRLVPLDEL